jgi:hypothetical protein
LPGFRSSRGGPAPRATELAGIGHPDRVIGQVSAAGPARPLQVEAEACEQIEPEQTPAGSDRSPVS